MNKNLSQSKDIYTSIKSVYSPYLKENIAYNSKGWGHIIRKNDGLRPSHEVAKRVKYIQDSAEIISISTTLQEYEERMVSGKLVIYYGFIAIVNKQKLKIIVRKNGNGGLHFYSLMTDYVTSPKRDRKNTT